MNQWSDSGRFAQPYGKDHLGVVIELFAAKTKNQDHKIKKTSRSELWRTETGIQIYWEGDHMVCKVV